MGHNSLMCLEMWLGILELRCGEPHVERNQFDIAVSIWYMSFLI